MRSLKQDDFNYPLGTSYYKHAEELRLWFLLIPLASYEKSLL